MELLFERDYISIYYDPRHFLVAQWRGYFNPTNFKEGLKMILHHIKAKGCQYGLNDGRLSKGTFLQNINWLGEEIFPKIVEAGVKRIAYVTNREFASLRSLERMLELTDEYEAQLFDDYEAAENWLLGKKENDVPKEIDKHQNKFVVKEKNKFVFLDFDEILYLFSFQKGTGVRCLHENYQAKESLKVMQAQLSGDFMQIHRSYIVNTKYVSAIKHHKAGSYHLFLKDMPGIKIPVSRTYVPAVKKLLQL